MEIVCTSNEIYTVSIQDYRKFCESCWLAVPTREADYPVEVVDFEDCTLEEFVFEY